MITPRLLSKRYELRHPHGELMHIVIFPHYTFTCEINDRKFSDPASLQQIGELYLQACEFMKEYKKRELDINPALVLYEAVQEEMEREQMEANGKTAPTPTQEQTRPNGSEWNLADDHRVRFVDGKPKVVTRMQAEAIDFAEQEKYRRKHSNLEDA